MAEPPKKLRTQASLGLDSQSLQLHQALVVASKLQFVNIYFSNLHSSSLFMLPSHQQLVTCSL